MMIDPSAKWLLPFLLCIPMAVHAQWEPIGTDRPDQTESTETIPKGNAQLETGFAVMPNADGAADLSLPQVLLRVGLGERFELRASGERTQYTGPDGETADAWAAPVLGLKAGLGLGGKSGIATAMEVNIGVPQWAGDDAGHPFAGLILAADRDLGERWGMGANVGLAWDGHSPFSTATASLTGGVELAPRLGAFAEL